MSTIYRCDRCGKEYTYMYANTITRYEWNTIDRSDPFTNRILIDLCFSCVIKVRELIKKKLSTSK